MDPRSATENPVEQKFKLKRIAYYERPKYERPKCLYQSLSFINVVLPPMVAVCAV